MSEYVLGRILPVFRGSYEVGTTYNKLDLVYVAGYGTYVAKTTVSSVQPESHPEIWQIVSKDITSQEVSELFNENESVRNQMVQTLIDNADEDIQNAITTLTNEITEKLNEVDGKIDGKIDELDGIKSTYTNQFNTLITDQTNTFNSNEEQRESKLDNAITTIQNADTTFKNGLQSEVHEFINTTDAEFEESQRERESEFNSTINSMNTQFNAAQSNRATTFNNSQSERNTQFNQSQTERNTQFTTQMTNQQNEFDSKESERDLATQAIINEHQALLDLDEKKANKDGYYVEMTTGFTEQLLSPDGITDEEPYIYRTSAGSTSISTGVAQVEKLEGNSIVWNQMCTGSFSNYNAKSVNTTDGITRVNLKAGDYYNRFTINSLAGKIVAGHKYLVKGFINDFQVSDKSLFYFNLLNYEKGFNGDGVCRKGEVFTFVASINTLSSVNDTIQLQFIYNPTVIFNDGDFVEFSKFQVFDLTQMFGEGNEPTIEQFKQWFPNDYYEYNTGEIINVNVDGLRTIGFNMWDEEWELKRLNPETGEVDVSYNDGIHSKNYIRVIPGATYYCCKTSDISGGVIVLCYNNKKEKIGDYIVATNNTFVIPKDCYYIRFYTTYRTTYYNDICINLSWSGYRNGDYEAYNEHNISIPVKEIKDANGNLLFPNGLLSTGTVKDEVTSDKAIKRIGVVDLGSLDYGNTAVTGVYNSSNISTLVKTPATWGTKANIICVKYEVREANNTNTSDAPDKGISVAPNGFVFIKDTNYTSGTTLKQSLTGVKLYFQLETPIEVDFKETPQVFGEKLNLTYFVDDFGTEEFTTTEPTAPVKHSTFYMTNLRDKIRNIDGNTDSGALMNNSLTNLLSTLSNALGGNLTKVWDSNNKVWQFTFTPNQTNGGLNNE